MRERYYEEYLVGHEKVINGTGKDKDATCSPHNHSWYYSGARYNLYKEMKYSGWCDNFYELYKETMNVLREVEYRSRNFVRYEWEAKIPDCREPCGIMTTNINQFIQETIRKRIVDGGCYRRDELVIGMCNEFAESTNVMIWKEFYEEFDIESILEFFTSNERRSSIMNRMAAIEKAGRKLSEIDRRVNMNATPEEFANYLKKPNISITEDIFRELKSMNRFQSFSKYIKEHHDKMGLKVFLPGDKKVVVSDVRIIKAKPIEVIRKKVINKVVMPEPVKEQIKIEVRKAEPVKVIKCNCNKELIIVKTNQEIMEIPATKKEAQGGVGNTLLWT
jgi:predicted CopG family antitoxin